MIRSLNPRLLAIALTSIPIVNDGINGLYNPPLYRASPSLFWAVDFASFIFVPILIALWLTKFSGIHPKQYGLQFPPALRGELLFSSVFFGAVLFILYFIPQRIIWAYSGYPIAEFSYGTAIPSGLLHFPVVVYLSISAGLMESVFMLSLPWFFWRQNPSLAPRPTLFAWASSIVFASVHWEQGLHGVVAAFVFGYSACLLYWKLNDLWPIVGAHTFVDIVEFF
jgi:membrane protease YdiL (CAAX protease family)